MKLIDCVHSVRRNVVVILLVGLVAAGGTYFLTSRQADVFEAKGRLVLGLSRTVADTTKGAALNNVSNRQVIATFAEVVGSSSVKDAAFEAAGIAPGTDGYSVTTVRLPEANGIEVRVDGPSPDVVASAASQVMRIGAAKFTALYPDFAATSIERPDVPDTRIEPRPKVMAVVALVLGLIVGFVIGLAIDQWRLSRYVVLDFDDVEVYSTDESDRTDDE